MVRTGQPVPEHGRGAAGDPIRPGTRVSVHRDLRGLSACSGRDGSPNRLYYARDVLGIQDAEHEETAPGAPTLFISRLDCALVGVQQEVILSPGTLVHRAYGEDSVTEQFRCGYGLNARYRDTLDSGGLGVVGVDAHGEVRIVALAGHPFFVATLFQPQLSSAPEKPHPLIVAYLRAAMACSARTSG